MKHFFSALALFLNLAPNTQAALPDIGEQPWMGCFAIAKSNKAHVKVFTEGGLLVQPISPKGEPWAYVRTPLTYGIEKTLPNGRKQILEVIPESLESDDETTVKFKETTIRGEVEGGATFEVVIEHNRGKVSIGGKVTSPGTHDAESLRFHVSARILNFYARKKRNLANDREAFEELIKDDSLKFKRVDGKKVELDFIEPRDMRSEEINGTGVKEAVVNITTLKKEFKFDATGKSSFTFFNRKGSELNEGMILNWTTDPKEDKKGDARFVFLVE